TIAGSLNADIEEIKDSEERSGILGFLRSGYEALFKKLPLIEPVNKSPDEYDLVIAGSPVWAGNLSSPVRTFMSLYGGKIRKVAFFTTYGIKSGKIFRQMEELSKSPIAVLEVREEEIKSGGYLGKVEDFIEKLRILNKI
ncbi:MAG: flavodoxin family protein, partial [Candidatus Bathyarchaeia archaeon]